MDEIVQEHIRVISEWVKKGNIKVLYCTPTFQMALDTMRPDLFESLGMKCRRKEKDLIEFDNGSTIHIKSVPNRNSMARLRGTRYDAAFAYGFSLIICSYLGELHSSLEKSVGDGPIEYWVGW